MVGIRLPEEMEVRLHALAESTGRTMSFYVREALNEYLDDLEDRYRGLYRLEHPGKRLSMEDVGRELGLED